MTAKKRKLSFERRIAQRGSWAIVCALLVALLAVAGIWRVINMWQKSDVYRKAETEQALTTLAASLDSNLQQELPNYCIGQPDLSLFACVRIIDSNGKPIFPDKTKVLVPASPVRYIPLLRQRVADIRWTGMPIAILTNSLDAVVKDLPVLDKNDDNHLLRVELGWRMAAEAIANNNPARALAIYQLLYNQFPDYYDADGFPVGLTARLEYIRLTEDKEFQASKLKEWRDDIISHYDFSGTNNTYLVMPVLLKRADMITKQNLNFTQKNSFLSLTNMLFPPKNMPCRVQKDSKEYCFWTKPKPLAQIVRKVWQASAAQMASNAFVYLRITAPDEPMPVGDALATNMFGITLSVVPFDAVEWYARRTRTAVIYIVLLAIVCLGAAIFAWRMNKLMKAERRLKQQELNFVAAVSHELRSPISAVKVMAEALEQGIVRDSNEQQKYGELIVKESNRLTQLVDNILDISRRKNNQTAAKKKPLRLLSFFEHVIKPFNKIEHTKITINCPAELKVMASEPLMERVIYNLLDNVVKYCVVDQECQIILTAREVDDSIELEVADNGIGISDDEQERIFEQFYRVGDELVRERPGTGLGLAIVKDIVERHEGSIRVESTLGVGSRFIIKLPK